MKRSAAIAKARTIAERVRSVNGILATPNCAKLRQTSGAHQPHLGFRIDGEGCSQPE